MQGSEQAASLRVGVMNRTTDMCLDDLNPIHKYSYTIYSQFVKGFFEIS